MAITMQMSILLIILCVLNFYFINIRKMEIVFSLMFIILLFIPPELVGILSGSPYSTPGIINLSMIGYDIIIIVILLIVFEKGKLHFRYSVFNRIKYVVLGLFSIILIRFIIDGMDFISNKIFDNYILPVMCALILINYMPKEKLPSLLNVIYIGIFINAIVACVEYLIGNSLILHDYYMKTVNWYPSIYNATQYGVAFRSTSFLGHPLTNGMYFIIGIVYQLNSNKKWNSWRMIQFAVLLAAMLTTNSRGVILVFSSYIMFYLISNKKGLKLCLLVSVAILILIKVDMQNLYRMLFARDESGSSLSVRLLALRNIKNISIENFIFGVGYNNVSSILNVFLSGANAEISYLIILLENGILGFFAWVMSLISLYTNNIPLLVGKIKAKGMINGMLICFLVYAATSNSFGDPGTLNYLLCALLAFSQIFSQDNREYTFFKAKQPILIKMEEN